MTECYDDRLRAADYEVRGVPQAVAEALVERHHYAKGGSNTAVFRHGLFRVGSRTSLGVAWWIPPTKGAAIASAAARTRRHPDGAGCDWRRVLSLSRLVVVPGVPKNAATYLLARSVRKIRESGKPWRCLVTFADTWRGHTGHIYRVGGWEELGLTEPEDVWVDPADGQMVSRKAGPKTRTRAQMEALGYRCEGRFAKYKFRLVLPQPRPKRNLFSFLGGDRGRREGDE